MPQIEGPNLSGKAPAKKTAVYKDYMTGHLDVKTARPRAWMASRSAGASKRRMASSSVLRACRTNTLRCNPLK
eukprot:3391156-Pleurochrysis_carterae.AAC.1